MSTNTYYETREWLTILCYCRNLNRWALIVTGFAKCSLLTYQTYLRDPELYPDFDIFRPERFLDMRNTEAMSAMTHGFGHVSFGFGRRYVPPTIHSSHWHWLWCPLQRMHRPTFRKPEHVHFRLYDAMGLGFQPRRWQRGRANHSCVKWVDWRRDRCVSVNFAKLVLWSL